MSKIVFQKFIHGDPHPGNILIRQNQLNPKQPQLVLLDHGIYIEVPDKMKILFCRLWRSLISFDYKELKIVADELGMGPHYKYLPLIFLFRTLHSQQKFGDPMNVDDRKFLYQKEMLTFEKLSYLLQDIPFQLVFMIRTANLVATQNATLGGSTRRRIELFAKTAIQQLHLSQIVFFFKYSYILFKVFLFENFYWLFSILNKGYVNEIQDDQITEQQLKNLSKK